MNFSSLLPLILGMACVLLAMAQMAELKPRGLAVVSLALAAVLALTGETASRISVAELAQWLAVPQRRQDLAALLLIEALVFGNQAIVTVQGRTTGLWRALRYVPPPSLPLALFLVQAWAMLAIDGADFNVLAWGVAVVATLLFSGGARLLHALLPDPLMRTGLRLWLHGVQMGAALWLARPPQPPVVSHTPALWDRLGLLMMIVIGLMALGRLWQRRTFFWNR